MLRQYPLGRLLALLYLLWLHVFIYLLIHRLQHKAFSAEMLASDALTRDQRM